ncbi:hybrid sensor histidine kinase/response regulator [Muricoccus aerilatus]|uniref:hybrid sensor histidine kinase/response regulator n=1 Tax=Muricoccus aerilatus TaxID=452982 RepID=UPI000A0301AF|nr:hybrid sensor histidine kinase/response regulator [Roseomonas aerilata]
MLFAGPTANSLVRAVVLGTAMLVPPALGTAVWAGWEFDRLREHTEAMLVAANAEIGGRADELLRRFEATTSGLRPVDVASDTITLTAKVLRSEPMLAPASGLVIASGRGRVAASSFPLSPGDVGTTWWFTSALNQPGQVAGFAGVGPEPRQGVPSYSLARRLPDGQGGTVGVVTTFISTDATGGYLIPAWLPSWMEARVGLEAVRAPKTLGAAKPGSTEALIARLVPLLREVADVSIADSKGTLGWSVRRSGHSLVIEVVTSVIERSSDLGKLASAWAAAVLLCWVMARRRPSAQAAMDVEKGDIARRLAETEERLGTVIEQRDRVLAAVGHDVRTPINSILGISAVLLDSDLEEAQRRWVHRVRASCEVLMAMLNGMLEAASAEVDGRETQMSSVDVSDLVSEVAEVFRPGANDKGLDFEVSISDAAAGSWRTDPSRLRQMLFNLVGNAVKFTDHGAVKISLSTRGVDAAEQLVLSVTDTGPGISDNERLTIFERFQRGRSEVAAGREGVGLGLALCREISDLLQGELALESRVGSGCTFTFSFGAQRIEEVRRGQTMMMGRSALVVGLSEGMRRRVVGYLERLGFTVDAAGDGFLGLGLAERAAHEHGAMDLVVLDAALTGLPADVFLTRLRSGRTLGRARVVLVAQGEMAAGAEGQADATVPHPVEERDLSRIVSGFFEGETPFHALDTKAPGSPEARILVAEDNKINQVLLIDVLGRAGFSAFGANNGEEAVQSAERGGFDVILMDLQMPVLGGIEAIQRIRSSEGPNAHVPIIALTAHTGAAVRRECIEAGATIVLHKPVDLARLTGQIREVIANDRLAEISPEPTSEGFEDIEVEWLDVLVAEAGAARARACVDVFLIEGGTRIRRLGELVEASEWAAVTRASHDFKGLAGTLGAARLAERLEELESAATAGAQDSAAAALAVTDAAWRRVSPCLRSCLEHAISRRSNLSRRAA